MNFGQILDTFSRRNKTPEPFAYRVTPELRNRVIHYCNDVFSGKTSQFGGEDNRFQFWEGVQKAATIRKGTGQVLIPQARPQTLAEDGINFVLNCTDEEFLDFLESIFKVDCFWRLHTPADEIVGELNRLLALDDIGYELTPYVTETVVEPANVYPFFGREVPTTKVVAYPQIMKKDNQVTQAVTVGPALTLLADPTYKAANAEYLDALDDYKKGDYGDCLTKCGSALESTLKIICSRKKWAYNQTDAAAKLLDIVKDNAHIESYLIETFKVVAMLRNKQSKAHGAGVQPKTVSGHTARYALSTTAAAICFLVEETK